MHPSWTNPRYVDGSLSYLIMILLKDFIHAKNLSIMDLTLL